MWKSQDILDWGIEVVRWFQQFSPALDWPFISLTFLGNLEFFLLFMPLLYWCCDRRAGARLLVLFLLSAYINSVAKVIFSQPRPFEYDSSVKQLVYVGGGGLPSGHTQSAVVVWGYLAAQVNKPQLWVLAGLLMIGIPLSRLYLGVHFPTDLIGGYVIGAVLLVVYLHFAPKVESWLAQKPIYWQLAVAISLPMALILLNPKGARYSLLASSFLVGFAPGMILERRWVRFQSNGSWLKRSVRYLVGLVMLAALWKGLIMVFDGLAPQALYRTLRYALMGLWCTWGAPWLFVRMKLARAG